jgi:hypothetical protein
MADPEKSAHDHIYEERERCLQIIEGRIRRLERVAERYPPPHANYSNIAASIENLKMVLQLILTGNPVEGMEHIDHPVKT